MTAKSLCDHGVIIIISALTDPLSDLTIIEKITWGDPLVALLLYLKIRQRDRNFFSKVS